MTNFHRHNKSVTGCKFAVGAEKEGKLIGVGIAGRPIARLADDGFTLEILRVCTDGTRNANSFIYGKLKTIGFMMGYKKIITYTLNYESGSSLKAIGARMVSEVKAGQWQRGDRLREFNPASEQIKFKWEL